MLQFCNIYKYISVYLFLHDVFTLGNYGVNIIILRKVVHSILRKLQLTILNIAALQKKINLLKAKYNNNSILNSALFNLNCSISL